MEFYVKKKEEYEERAADAYEQKKYRLAFEYAAKAAEITFDLAEKASGKMKEAWTEEAEKILKLAERIKKRADEIPDGEDTGRPVAVGADETESRQFKLQRRPSQKFSDVAGLQEVKDILMEDVILPFKHPHVYERYGVKPGTGVLMYGPPGNGKTYIAKAIAGELDADFFPVLASSIKDKYVGETEKNMERLFEEASQSDRAVVFIDEAEGLLGRRGNEKINAVQQFLALTDGLKENENCLLLLAATNRPWLLDGAVTRPGRLGQHVYVGLPDLEARKAIVLNHLNGPISVDLYKELDSIAESLEGYSGADIAQICKKAALYAIKSDLESGEEGVITPEYVYSAMDVIRPSVSPEVLSEFEAWSTGTLRDDEDGEG